jgi:hypothetical protein
MRRDLRLFVAAFLAGVVLNFPGSTCVAAQVMAKADAQATSDPAYEGSRLLNVPLVWKPTDTVSALDAVDLTGFKNVTFTIKPFSDERKRPSEIGKNVEKRLTDKVLYVTTSDNVAAWLTDRFARVLSEFDVTMVKSGGTLSLEADIIKFYVTEESLYKADVALKVRVRSKNGDVLWEGMVSASASRWGSSYKADNYYEGLSNATISVVHSLLKNDQFLQAVQKNR